MTKSRRTFLKVAGMGSVGLLACGDDGGTLDAASTDAGMRDAPGSDAPGSDVSLEDAALVDAPLTDAELEDTGPYVDNGLAPVLSNYRVAASEPSRVYFDSSKPITASTTEGFTVSGRMISGITINVGALSGHYVTVNEAFSFWDNNTIRYAGGSDVADPDERALYPFDLQYIVNNIPEPDAPIERYVSVSGAGSSDGTSEANAWTMAEAGAQAVAGQTVRIKAGDYGDRPLEIANDGADGSPIKFVGYTTTPGDAPTLVRDQDTIFDDALMPHIHTSGGAFGVSAAGRHRIIIKNIQITGYEHPLRATGNVSEVLIENVYVRGGVTGINFFAYDTTSARIKGCFVSNSSGAGIRVSGQYNLVEDIYVSSRGTPGMDYYVSFYGGTVGVGNIVRNSAIVRDPIDAHTGHGYGFKGATRPIEHSLIENCTSHNVYHAIEARHSEIRYNVFRNIRCTRDEVVPEGAPGQRNAGVKFSAASYNTVDNVYVKGGQSGVWFHAGTEDPAATTAGHHNIIKNSVFEDCSWMVSESEDLAGRGRVAHDNQIIGCTIINPRYIALVREGPSSNNKFVDCLFSSVLTAETVDGNESNFAYEHCSFHDLAFPMPGGVDLLELDPMFSPSPIPTNVALKAGVVTEVKYDRDGTERADPPTIGAVEIP